MKRDGILDINTTGYTGAPTYQAGSIERWMRSNMQYIEFVPQIDEALTRDPVQAMFCGGVEAMRRAKAKLLASNVKPLVTVLRTEYLHRDLCMGLAVTEKLLP